MARKKDLGTLAIDGAEFDIGDLDLDDIEFIEDYTGSSFGDLDWTRAKTLKAVAFVVLRRQRPEFTIEDAGKIKLVSFEAKEDKAPAPADPTEPAPDEGEPNA
jgi:hypothetical protein